MKRAIGLPGDVVAMRNNCLAINGVEARYSDVEYTAEAIFAIESYGGMTHRIELAPTGASRFSSFGRVRGFVPRGEIVGDAKTVEFSIDYDHYYLPRMDRLFRDL